MSPATRLNCGVSSQTQDGIELLATTFTDITHLYTELETELERRPRADDHEDVSATISESLKFITEDLTGRQHAETTDVETLTADIQFHKPTGQELDGVHESLKTIQTELRILYGRLRETPEITTVQTEELVRTLLTRGETAEYVVNQLYTQLQTQDTPSQTIPPEQSCPNNCPPVQITALTGNPNQPPIQYCPYCGESYTGQSETDTSTGANTAERIHTEHQHC